MVKLVEQSLDDHFVFLLFDGDKSQAMQKFQQIIIQYSMTMKLQLKYEYYIEITTV